MNKNELIAAITEETGLTKKDVTAVTNALLGKLADAMVSGDKVHLVGFGTFEVRNRAARSGKNPQTGEPVKIAACKVPAFKPGKALKEAVNK